MREQSVFFVHLNIVGHLQSQAKQRPGTQNVVELIQVVFPREDGPVGQHLRQDATHRPDVYGLGVALEEKAAKTASQRKKRN